MLSCPIFWQNVQSWLIQLKVIPPNSFLSQLTCLGLVNKTNGFLVHHALLLGRFHIYTSKLKKKNCQTCYSFHNQSLNGKTLKSVMHLKRTQQKSTKRNGNPSSLKPASQPITWETTAFFFSKKVGNANIIF